MRNKIAFLVLILAIFLFYLTKYRESSERLFVIRYCKEVTKELLRMNRSCECNPAEINGSLGCLCSCEVSNRTLNIFLRISK